MIRKVIEFILTLSFFGGILNGQRIGYIRVSSFEQNPERQREGIELAKQRKAYRGRKKSLNSEQIDEMKLRIADGQQKTQVARDFCISRETLYQYLRLSES